MNPSLETMRRPRIEAVGIQRPERANHAGSPAARHGARDRRRATELTLARHQPLEVDRTDRILFWTIWLLLILFALVVMRLA